MDIIRRSFSELFPEKPFNYTTELKYSGRLKGINANIKLYKKQLTVTLGRLWEDVSDDIKMGVIQHLLKKLLRYNGQDTLSMELYEKFAKQLSDNMPVTENHPVLDASFRRVNSRYFDDLMERPNLKWGRRSTIKLAGYDYQSDTIKISSIFKETPIEWLDYLMYHELLHKKLKYHTKSERNFHHTPEFRRLEKKYDNFDHVDRQIRSFLREVKLKVSPVRRKRRLFDWF